jgi:hypothetical protein
MWVQLSDNEWENDQDQIPTLVPGKFVNIATAGSIEIKFWADRQGQPIEPNRWQLVVTGAGAIYGLHESKEAAAAVARALLGVVTYEGAQ